MGILKTILIDTRDIASALLKTQPEDIINISKKMKSYDSLSKKAKEGILQFPVITSRSLDMETTSLVARALERQYSSFVQVVMSMNATTLMSDERGVSDFIRQFHQNTDAKKLDGLTNLKPGAMMESVEYDTEQFEGYQIQSLVVESTTGKILSEHRAKLTSVMESFREDILNNKYIPTEPGVAPKKVIKGYNKVLREANETVHAVLLKDSDVKKANELVPTTLQLKLNIQDKTGKIVGTQEFIIGVKATLHAVSSEEMIANVGGMNRGKMFNFIRWTTGEIEFVKDLLFNIDEIKTDVVNRSQGTSNWWMALKQRAKFANAKKKLLMKGQILPNATIVMSMEEVDHLKYEKGLDLMDLSNANKLMREFFLLGFVIVDNSSQICHFLFDGRHDFESTSFSGLERENKGNGLNINDVIKLVNKF